MKPKNGLDEKSLRPPLGLDEEQEFAWKWRDWRSIFLNTRSRIKKGLLADFAKVNIPAIFLGILMAIVVYYLNPLISLSSDSLITLSIGIMTASAAILTIITAFLTFWFGSATNNMERARSMLRDELSNLGEIEESVDPFTAGPQESVTGALRDNVTKLAEKSKAFMSALKTMGGRFHRAAIGTYYDSSELVKLDLVIKHTGGEWFVAYANAFKGYEHRDFSKKIWLRATEISRRICALNDEIMRASVQLKQITKFMPILTSILFIFIFALVVAFLSSTTYSTDKGVTLLPLTRLVFGSLLIVLLPVHLVSLVRLLWSLVSSKYFACETNRVIDLRYTRNVESRHPIDYESAFKKEIETMLAIYSQGKKEKEKE